MRRLERAVIEAARAVAAQFDDQGRVIAQKPRNYHERVHLVASIRALDASEPEPVEDTPPIPDPTRG